MGCRPHLCRKKPRRAQQHTHCDWRAAEQPAGGTQLRGSRIPPPFANTGVCAVMVFVTRLLFLSSRLKSLPTSRAVTLRRWPSWRTNTANYWSVSAQRGLWLCFVRVWVPLHFFVSPAHPASSVNPITAWHKSASALCLLLLPLNVPPFCLFSVSSAFYSSHNIFVITSILIPLNLLIFFLASVGF